jgi:glycosyltransferase involved in cell wall biosynthesis
VQSLAESISLPESKPRISNKFHFFLDEPRSWDCAAYRLRLSGWCVAKQGPPLVAVRARVGKYIVERRFDVERPDVAAYIGLANSPAWCGFRMEIQVPPRKNRLELEARTEGGKWQQVFSIDVRAPHFPVAKDELLMHASDSADRFPVHIDQPAEWKRPRGTLYVSGWCVDRSGAQIKEIVARVGRHRFRGNYGISRPDVGALHPNTPHAARSGFAIAARLPAGAAELTLNVRGADGQWHSIVQREVIGNPSVYDNPPAGEEWYFSREWTPRSRLESWVDPLPDWSQKRRYVQLSGWCFATSGPEVSEVRARVRREVFPAYYGIPRPDVSMAYERRPGSLRNGFSVDVIVPWGWSTLVLEARARGSEWEPFFTQRVRGPHGLHREDRQSDVGNYPGWIRQYDTLTHHDRSWVTADIRRLKNPPLFSILMPVYNPQLSWLQSAIESVRTQLYENWELCVVDDASPDVRIWKLLQRYARLDSRIRVARRSTNAHISVTSNDALALATGDFIALLDHDDELAPTALYFAARELNADPRVQFLYTDEDKLDRYGRRFDPHFKPDWNPDLFTCQNYISHLTIHATALARSVGGFRCGFEGSQDYDLSWRCVEKLSEEQIRHIPHILYHWRATRSSVASQAQAKPYALTAARRAVQEHFDRRGIAASVEPHREIYLRPHYQLTAHPPLVSIIIPTRDRVEFLRACVESIFSKTDYPNFELIIIDNQSRQPQTQEYLAALAANSRAQVHSYDSEFNFSRLNNLGVAHAHGSLIALLNNDLEVINCDWLSEMVSHALRPEIGAVGARLWYPNGAIQHAGVILGAGGIGNHAHAGVRDEASYFSRAHLTQNFSAVTAACMLLRKETYCALGGLDEMNLPVAFNDVDFCLRLLDAGLRVVWTPHAELIHHESMSRGFEDTLEKRQRFLAESEYMRAKWGERLETDPAYNPNLSLGPQLFTLAWPPRVEKPWSTAAVDA